MPEHRGWKVKVGRRSVPVIVFRTRADLRRYIGPGRNAATWLRDGHPPTILLHARTTIGSLAHESEHLMEALLGLCGDDEQRAEMVGRFTESLSDCVRRSREEWKIT